MKYEFFIGSNLIIEIERDDVPEIIFDSGINNTISNSEYKSNIIGNKYNIKLNPSKTKVEIDNVFY